MRPKMSVRYLCLVILLFAAFAQAADEEQIVMSEEALWAAAGETYDIAINSVGKVSVNFQ